MPAIGSYRAHIRHPANKTAASVYQRCCCRREVAISIPDVDVRIEQPQFEEAMRRYPVAGIVG